jgi:cholesterol oxidase
MAAPGGTFRLFAPTGQDGVTRMVYELAFEHAGTSYYLAGHKKVQNDHHGTDLFEDTTTLYTVLHSGTDSTAPAIGAGILRLGLPDLLRLSSTLRVVNASNIADQTRALATFGRFFMGNLWETYGPKPRA